VARCNALLGCASATLACNDLGLNAVLIRTNVSANREAKVNAMLEVRCFSRIGVMQSITAMPMLIEKMVCEFPSD